MGEVKRGKPSGGWHEWQGRSLYVVEKWVGERRLWWLCEDRYGGRRALLTRGKLEDRAREVDASEVAVALMALEMGVEP